MQSATRFLRKAGAGLFLVIAAAGFLVVAGVAVPLVGLPALVWFLVSPPAIDKKADALVRVDQANGRVSRSRLAEHAKTVARHLQTSSTAEKLRTAIADGRGGIASPASVTASSRVGRV